MSNQKLRFPSGNAPRTIQVPPFLLESTADLSLFLDVKRSLNDMFVEWILSENYKGRIETEYSSDLFLYVNELLDELHKAQQEGSTEIVLSMNLN